MKFFPQQFLLSDHLFLAKDLLSRICFMLAFFRQQRYHKTSPSLIFPKYQVSEILLCLPHSGPLGLPYVNLASALSLVGLILSTHHQTSAPISTLFFSLFIIRSSKPQPLHLHSPRQPLLSHGGKIMRDICPY